MKGLVCRRCNRVGTRDFRRDGNAIVCQNEVACRRRATRNKEERARQAPPGPYGTLFFAAKVTRCSLCSGTIHPTMMVVQTSWTRRIQVCTGPEPVDHEPGVARGEAAAVHLECAERNGLRVEWTEERILGDLRRIIKSIPIRKLRRPLAAGSYGNRPAL